MIFVHILDRLIFTCMCTESTLSSNKCSGVNHKMSCVIQSTNGVKRL